MIKPMKGPFERLKYDLRRLWECPACQRRERTAGTETSRFCQCTAKDGGKPTSMRLTADGPQRLVPVIAGPKWEAPVDAPAIAAPPGELPSSEAPLSEAPPPEIPPAEAS
ncbi:MAG: hypothetical protein SFU86_03940 [Pirellulaceae bacterium]|nr:hypothetical protein [Pirellulaceae bacterium]